jgi:lipid A 3-O-deacylase
VRRGGLCSTLAAGALSLASSVACAGDGARWYLQVDNDVVFGSDRWYTSGVRIARVQRSGDHDVEAGLVQEIYTPEARYYELGRTDRAPAARLLGSLARHDRSGTLFQTLELQLGVRGPAALGRQTTDFVHRLIAADVVDWSRQERNAVDASVIAARTHEAGPVNVHYGLAAGTQLTFAHAGIELRTSDGAARSVYSPVLRFAATPPFARTGNDSSGWNAFVGASVRVLARNELVSKPYGVLDDDLRYKRAIVRSAAGLTWTRSWGSVAFVVAQDTRDFDRQRTPQKFGSLTVFIDF